MNIAVHAQAKEAFRMLLRMGQPIETVDGAGIFHRYTAATSNGVPRHLR